MRVSIFGLGYVGSVSAACFAERKHHVIGVDTNPVKVDMIKSGRSPIIEPQLSELIEHAVNNNYLTATIDTENAIFKTDISFVCVGTPSNNNGSIDTRHLENACRDIGQALAKKNSFHTVAIRSTLLPGTMRNIVIPILENVTGWTAGKDFGVCNNPEFLREGTAIDDFNHPAKTVIGSTDSRSGNMVAELYQGLPGQIIHCAIETGEMIKYTDNAWHANKITFANEIGAFCKANNIDSHQVMDVFCQDDRLNISRAYLKPGFAFGGSCLPKDLRALTHKARNQDLQLPLLHSILTSNQVQIEQALETITSHGKKSIGILGFSFKAGTDDLRESPMVQIIERLIGKGYDLKLYDQSVNIAKLVGANRDYIMKAIPHIERLMANDVQEVLAPSEVIVIGHNAPEFAQIGEWLRPEQQIVDFVRIPTLEKHQHYNGICW